MRAGASPCWFIRPDGCGYLLLLAIASESFNFVYLLIKEAVHVEAVFEKYRVELDRMVLRALEHQRFPVLDLLHFCGYTVRDEEEEVQEQLDSILEKCLLKEDFAPIERVCRLGFSLWRFAERKQEMFATFVQTRLEAEGRLGKAPPTCAAFCDKEDGISSSESAAAASSSSGSSGSGSSEAAPPSSTSPFRHGVHPAIRRLARLDRRSLELHFRSPTFLQFAGNLLNKKSFVALRQIVEVHPYAFDAYFMEHYAPLEAMLLDAFLLKDISLIVDLSSLSFPMGPFFMRHQHEVDGVLLREWLPKKCWTELGMLKSEIKDWSFPLFFARNEAKTDAFVVGIVSHGYWYDLHNLSQLSFGFASFFDRCFEELSAAVLNFIQMPHPHFVLLRELSALNFPWGRFMQVHHDKIIPSKDHDFLQFVISLEGFELGSKVYGVVEQTRRLYYSMAATMFNSGCAASLAADDSVVCTHSQQASASSSSSCSSSSATSLPGKDADTSVPPSEGPAESADQSSAAPGFDSDHPAGTESTVAVTSGAASSSNAASSAPRQAKRNQRLFLPRKSGGEAARALRARAQELARQAYKKKLHVKHVLMLMICKGAYCWNPLLVLFDEEQDDQEPGGCAELEGALSFLEPREGSALAQAYGQLLPHHMHALALGAAAAAAAAASIHPPAPGDPTAAGAGITLLAGTHAAHGHPAGFWLSPPVQFASPQNPGIQQLLFHVVCLAQRVEERAFGCKIDLFWHGILEDVLPHPRGVA